MFYTAYTLIYVLMLMTSDIHNSLFDGICLVNVLLILWHNATSSYCSFKVYNLKNTLLTYLLYTH